MAESRELQPCSKSAVQGQLDAGGVRGPGEEDGGDGEYRCDSVTDGPTGKDQDVTMSDTDLASGWEMIETSPADKIPAVPTGGDTDVTLPANVVGQEAHGNTAISAEEVQVDGTFVATQAEGVEQHDGGLTFSLNEHGHHTASTNTAASPQFSNDEVHRSAANVPDSSDLHTSAKVASIPLEESQPSPAPNTAPAIEQPSNGGAAPVSIGSANMPTSQAPLMPPPAAPASLLWSLRPSEKAKDSRNPTVKEMQDGK